MSSIPLFKSALFHIHWAIPLANLFLGVWFVFAFFRHRTQWAFLIWSLGGFSATVVSAFLLCSRLKQSGGADLFPDAVWRMLVFANVILEPAQFVCGILGAVVLVWTYPKASRRRGG